MADRALTAVERERIAVGLRLKQSYAEIAREIGRDRSVVWREVRRNNSHHFGYVGVYAQRHAERRRRRPKTAKLRRPGRLRTRVLARVLALLRGRWSPQQVAARLRREFPDQPEMWVSHETIYQAIYVQSGCVGSWPRRCGLGVPAAVRRPAPLRRGAGRG